MVVVVVVVVVVVLQGEQEAADKVQFSDNTEHRVERAKIGHSQSLHFKTNNSCQDLLVHCALINKHLYTSKMKVIVRKERCSDVIVSEFLGAEKQSSQARREQCPD